MESLLGAMSVTFKKVSIGEQGRQYRSMLSTISTFPIQSCICFSHSHLLNTMPCTHTQFGGGDSSTIFVRGWATSGFQTPSFNKAYQCQTPNPFERQIREKVGRNCLKMYVFRRLSKLFTFEVSKSAFLGGKLQF